MAQTLRRTELGAVDPAAAHARLRAATADAHERVEATLDAPARCADRDRYHELVQWFAEVHGAFEPVLRAVDARLGGRLGASRRVRLPWLHADLAALGGRPDRAWTGPVRRALGTVRPDSAAGALGLQYVIEGSALGGRVLARIAGQHVGVDATTGGRFLHGHGRATATRWRAWWEGLPGLITAADLPTVEGSARATFAALMAAATALVDQEGDRIP